MKKLKFPKIPSSEYIKIRKTDYDLMKKMAERQDNFAVQIMNQNKEIQSLNEELNTIKEKNKKLIGKIGGMQKAINYLTKKNKTLSSNEGKNE